MHHSELDSVDGDGGRVGRVDTAENDGTQWHTRENRTHTQKGSHGAHSQEWHTPSHDPHTVGLGFGNEKISDPAGMCFLTRGLQNW